MLTVVCEIQDRGSLRRQVHSSYFTACLIQTSEWEKGRPMVLRFGGANSQVKDMMLTITNLIRESFSFLLLLMELQVRDVRQRHNTLQTRYTAHCWQIFLHAKNKPSVHQKPLEPQSTVQHKISIKLTMRGMRKKCLQFVDLYGSLVYTQVYLIVHIWLYTHAAESYNHLLAPVHTSNVFTEVFCRG